MFIGLIVRIATLIAGFAVGWFFHDTTPTLLLIVGVIGGICFVVMLFDFVGMVRQSDPKAGMIAYLLSWLFLPCLMVFLGWFLNTHQVALSIIPT